MSMMLLAILMSVSAVYTSAFGADLFIGCYAQHTGTKIWTRESVEECIKDCPNRFVIFKFPNSCFCGGHFSWSISEENLSNYSTCSYYAVYYSNNDKESVNLAMEKPVRQSSSYYQLYVSRAQYYYYDAKYAVDGNKDPNFGVGGSCSHTNNIDNPWFVVDLESSFHVETVVITRRNDEYMNRLTGLTIHLTNEEQPWEKLIKKDIKDFVLCNQYNDDTTEITITITCTNNTLSHRFVVLTLPGKVENIAMCELEVFEGTPEWVSRILPCPKGFTRQHPWNDCTDVDECDFRTISELIPTRCNSSTTHCSNNEGGYKCSCQDGFEKSNGEFNCVDIDECHSGTNTHKCRFDSTSCLNTDGGYYCSCKNGFRNSSESEYFCEDINECVENDTCIKDNTTCENTKGSFFCTSLFLGEHTIGNFNYVIYVLIGIGVPIASALVYFLYVRHREKKQQVEINAEGIPMEAITTENDNSGNSGKNEFIDNNTDRVKLDNLENKIKFLEDSNGFSKEYDAIPKVSHEPMSYAKMSVLKPKNRYRNLYPYNKNRVLLRKLGTEDQSDYVNASHIQDCDGNERFIAAQGPLKQTVNDFWRMVSEHNVGIIVMLTQLLESGKEKCHKYWADGTVAMYGSAEVKHVDEVLWEDFVQRKFEISQVNSTQGSCDKQEQRNVIQWQYTAWPDHKTPKNAINFLKFRSKIRQSMEEQNQNSKVLVHCSAGVGRTGCFIAIDHLLEEAKREGSVDVVSCVATLREQRPYMVQTIQQHKFIYTVLMGSLQWKTTCIPLDRFHEAYKTFTFEEPGSKSQILEEFERLNKKAKFPNKENNSRMSSGGNRWKPRFVKDIVQDVLFIFSTVPDEKDFDYFYQTCSDHLPVIFYIKQSENETTQFIPNQYSESLEIQNFTVEFLERLVVNRAEVTKINLINTARSVLSSKIYENITILKPRISQSVINSKEITVVEAVHDDSIQVSRQIFLHCKELINASLKINATSETQNVFIISNDHDLIGFYVACFGIVQQMMRQKEIDLFDIASSVRKSFYPDEIFTEIQHYHHLYEFVNQELLENPINYGISA